MSNTLHVSIQNFSLFPDRNIPINSLNKEFIYNNATRSFCRYARSTIVIANCAHCNQTHVELNNDIKAPCTRADQRNDTRRGRNEAGAIVVCHVFNILDVYVYSRCRISSGATWMKSRRCPTGCFRPLESFQKWGSHYATLNVPNNIARV